jgi:hypothetical protein
MIEIPVMLLAELVCGVVLAMMCCITVISWSIAWSQFNDCYKSMRQHASAKHHFARHNVCRVKQRHHMFVVQVCCASFVLFCMRKKLWIDVVDLDGATLTFLTRQRAQEWIDACKNA